MRIGGWILLIPTAWRGDDEAENAMRQMQMITSDVDLMAPLYRDKDDGELRLRNGRPARMLNFGLMILEHGHWISIVALYASTEGVWHVSITGVPRLDQQDEADWKTTLNQLTGIKRDGLFCSTGTRNLP